MSDIYNYALFTMQTGGRPMAAFSEIFETLYSTISSKLDAIEEQSGSTHRRSLEIALSDTTILMVYALSEGFFFEEYSFYFKGSKPKNLTQAIKRLLTHLKIEDSELMVWSETICNLQQARNAIVHRNGFLKNDEKKAILDNFDGKISVSYGYPAATADDLRGLVNAGNRLISKYNELTLGKAVEG